jgi:predicted PurR-regulated permease PerM
MEKIGAILKIITIIISFMVILKLCLIFLWPFIVSLLIVLLLEPLIGILRNTGLSRKICVVLSFLILALLSIAAITFLTS